MIQTAAALIAVAAALADSSSARWPARAEAPIRVWVQPWSPAEEWETAYVVAARTAFREWNRLGLSLHFTFTSDSALAEVGVTWTDRFSAPMSGSTTTTLHDAGRIVHAEMLLAVHHPDGRRLDAEEVRVLALHEIGHALGLEHSDDQHSVMARTVRVRGLSGRDRAAARRHYDASGRR